MILTKSPAQRPGFITGASERNILIVVWIAVAVAVCSRIIFGIYTHRVWEDALITVLHSENFYNGLGLTHYKPDEPPIHGFTSPISVLIPLAGDFFHIGFGLYLQKIVSVICGGLTVWFGYKTLNRYTDSQVPWYAILLACGYLAIEHHQILWGMAGMETQVACAVLLASMALLRSAAPGWVGLSLGLCLLARPDFVLWVAIAGLSLLIDGIREKSYSRLLIAVGVASAVYLPWIVFTILYYGSPIPNTIIAKSIGYNWQSAGGLQAVISAFLDLRRTVFYALGPSFGGNGTGFVRLWDVHGLMMYSVIGLVIFGFWTTIRKRQFIWWPIYGFLAIYICFFTFYVSAVFGWYAVPVNAVAVILAAKGLMDITALLPRGNRAMAGGTAAAAYISVLSFALPVTLAGEKHIQEFVEDPIRISIGKYLNQAMAPSETVGAECLGFMGYYSRRAFYDYPGLVSRKIPEWLKTDRSNLKVVRMLGHFQPDYVVLRPAEYVSMPASDTAFLKNYELQRVYKVKEEDRSRLLFGDANADLEFHVFKKISRSPPQAP